MIISFAEQIDISNKAIKVLESVTRTTQKAAALKYADLAIAAIEDSHVRDRIYTAKWDMQARLNKKPKYRYDNKSGTWAIKENKVTMGMLSNAAQAQSQSDTLHYHNLACQGALIGGLSGLHQTAYGSAYI